MEPVVLFVLQSFYQPVFPSDQPKKNYHYYTKDEEGGKNHIIGLEKAMFLIPSFPVLRVTKVARW